uniref:I-box binding factor n=1 Tax=Solanum tuberosum TaxID=4113 RepID=M1AJ50_SOLTU
MNTNQTCNNSFWTKEEDKLFENTVAINKDNNNLLEEMEEALPGKSAGEDILIEDINVIESGYVPLPNHPEMQNQNSKADAEWRKGASWTEQEHMSFLRGIEINDKGDWRSISRHCVITRTAKQEDAEATGTSQVPHTEYIIGSAYGGSQAVPNTSNESMLPRESTNAEQMIEVVGGESTDHNAVVNVGSDVNVDAGSSLLPSKQSCTAASSGTYGHPISRIGSELEALLTEPMDEDNDITTIFDVGKAPTSYPVLFDATLSGVPRYSAAEAALAQLPPFDDEGIFDPDDLFTDPMF